MPATASAKLATAVANPTKQQVRVWCQEKWGRNTWWDHPDKKQRMKIAKAALEAGKGPTEWPPPAAGAEACRAPEEENKKRAAESVDASSTKKQKKNKAQCAVVDETTRWSQIRAWLIAKYGNDWEDPPDDACGYYEYGLRCDRAYERVREAREALAQEPLPPDFDADLEAATAIAREFMEYRADKKFNGASCFSCKQKINEAHLYLIDMTANRKAYRHCYPVGCSHVDYDNEEWCDGCCTLIRIKDQPVVQCTRCAQIDWGRPEPTRDYWSGRGS